MIGVVSDNAIEVVIDIITNSDNVIEVLIVVKLLSIMLVYESH